MGMIQHYLVFDRKDLRDFGVWISGNGTFNAPARDVTTFSVPGRNGNLTYDNGKYNNISITYPCFISRNFEGRVEELREWLCSHIGYYRIEDTYHQDEYRLGMYKGGFTATPTARNLAGKFNLVFDCKPQRYLKSGEIEKSISNSGVLYNPTLFTALPTIKCTGTSGSITVNDITVSASSLTSGVTLDCESMEAYEGTTNRNNNITLTNGAFPVLAPGVNTISFTGFSAVKIIPRWWRL